MPDIKRAGGHVLGEHGWEPVGDGNMVEVEVVESSYECDDCDFTAKSAGGLGTHQRAKHTPVEEPGEQNGEDRESDESEDE